MEPYRVIVAGNRGFDDEKLAFDYLDKINQVAECMHKKMTIISGTDTIGTNYAKSRNLECIEMPADWDKYSESAGYIRNKEMAKAANFAIVFWDGEYNSSEDMINIMNDMNKPVWVILYKTK